MLQLRDYQEECVNKMLWSLSLPGNDLISIAQGGGKSLIIADFAHKSGKPILILVPSKELLEQDVDKMLQCVPDTEIGIYSASKNRKDISTFTFATIQSAHKHPEEFVGFDIVIMDECHLYPLGKKTSMYKTLFSKAGIKKVYGMTGTPYRGDTYYNEPPEGWVLWKSRKWKNYRSLEVVTTTKMLTRFQGGFWSRMLYVLNTDVLLEKKYLTPLKYTDKTLLDHSQIPLNQSKSEFDWEAFDCLIQEHEKEVIDGIKWASTKHQTILVFCAGVEQAQRMSQMFPRSAVVSADTPKREREKIVKGFKDGTIHLVFNCSVLLTGFDCPRLTCVIITLPTRSLTRHAQLLGRGTRLYKDKEFCEVIDYVGNVKNLGTLESIKVKKVGEQWNVVSNTKPDGWHMAPMMTFKLRLPSSKV